jgi:hypothetical protein
VNIENFVRFFVNREKKLTSGAAVAARRLDLSVPVIRIFCSHQKPPRQRLDKILTNNEN